jgi:hypothetical protein
MKDVPAVILGRSHNPRHSFVEVVRVSLLIPIVVASVVFAWFRALLYSIVLPLLPTKPAKASFAPQGYPQPLIPS